MPNQPKTPQSSFRIPADLRDAAKAKAKERGESLTAVVVRALDHYVRTPGADQLGRVHGRTSAE